MPEASPIEKISPSKSEAHGRIVAWSGDHGSKVCVARMRANVPNWLSSTTSRQQFPPLPVFRAYPLIPVIPVILYCNGRSAGSEVHLATQGSRDHPSACMYGFCTAFCYCTARTCCGPSFVQCQTLLLFARGFVRGCCRSRMRSMIPCKPQIYYCRKTKRDL